MTQNQIAFFKAKEEQRHNVVAEAETGRHNRQDEAIRYEGNQINREANTINQMHFERMDDINREHYERADYEQKRHNMAEEGLKQSNINLGYAQLDYNYANLRETRRHNKKSESQTTRQLNQRQAERKETIRHNRATEKISKRTLNETTRHNKQQEAIGFGNVNAAYIQAGAATRQAGAAEKNAAANYLNAETNEWKSQIDANRSSRELDIKQQQADVAQKRADTERDRFMYESISGQDEELRRWFDTFIPF